MKLKQRILSLILSVSILTLIMPFNVIAETTEDTITGEETVTDTFEVKLSPENYATIYLNQIGYSNHNTTRALELYYNTPYTANDNIYTEHGSIISSYIIPLKKQSAK